MVAALALFVRNHRDLPALRIPDRSVRVLGPAVVAVALVAGPVAATVAGRTASPQQAVEMTEPLLDTTTLADAGDVVRDWATWRPWQHWAILESGYEIDGGASGSGAGV